MTKQMYVSLEEGDIIQDGDEWLEGAGIWRKSFCTGQSYNISNHGLMRRPVSQPTSETVSPTLHKCGEIAISQGGLTKREWFAGMALSGLKANSDWIANIKDTVQYSYEFADAMIKAGKETE